MPCACIADGHTVPLSGCALLAPDDMRIRTETTRCWLSSTPGSGLTRRPVDTCRRTDPEEDQPQRAPSAGRPGQNWLTRNRRSIRQRTSRLPFTAMDTRHVNERSATRNRSTHRNWRTHRRAHRNRRTHGHRRDHRNRPRQCHRNASHVGEWSATRTAHARYRRCTTSLALRRDACVAAGYHRGGRNVRAQRYSDPAQPSPDRNYSDV